MWATARQQSVFETAKVITTGEVSDMIFEEAAVKKFDENDPERA